MAIEATNNEMPATPFVGLNPFRTEEAILFFGRRQHTIELLNMLREDHFIAVVGSSGSGKSSLIRAGLIPQLKAGFLVEARDRWRVAVMKPGDAPLRNLAHSLTKSDDLTESIRNGGTMAIVDALEPLLAEHEENLLLVVDQFEELFRFGIESGQPDKRDEAGDFVNILLELAAQSDLPCFVVLTMRSDFIGDCDNFYGLPEALNRSQFLVPRLTREQRRQAIEGPIRLFKADITPRLLDRVVNDVGDHSDQLPVMQHALMRTWELMQRSGDATMDLLHYQAIGGIQEALALDANRALRSLPENDQPLAKRLFQALTDTDARNRRIRRPAKLSELASITGATADKGLALIENFKAGGRSFLTLSQDADPIVDISHESLIRQWTTMGEWVSEEAESRAMLLRLVDAARFHQAKPHDENFWRGSQLEVATEWWETRQPNNAWASRYSDDFALAQTFLAQSRDAQAKAEAEKEAQRKQSLRRTQKFVAGLTIALIAALALAFYAWKQQTKAKEQEQYARRLTYIANINLAADAIERDIGRANELLVQYLPGTETSEEENYRSFYWYHLMKACHVKGLPLSGHGDAIYSVAWSVDGKALASGSADKTIRLWDVTSGKELRTLSGHEDAVYSVAWSVDGKTLASASADKTIKLWEVASGQELRTLSGHEDAVHSVAWSSDGKTLASASTDKTIKLWDVASGKELRTLSVHGVAVISVAWSSDGKTLASGGEDKIITLWDGSNGKALRTLTGHGGAVRSVAWSSDGKTLASGSEDKTIKLWDVASGQELRTLSGHGKAVTSVTWSSDGKTLASGSRDKTIRLWEVAKGQELRALSGYWGPVSSVSFSRDSKTLATGGADQPVKLWDVASGKELRALSGHGGAVRSVAWSVDGKTLASGSVDRTIKLWEVASGKELRTLGGHGDTVRSVAWSVDGKTLASASADKMIKLWDVASSRELRTLNGHAGGVLSLAWSSDSKLLASGGGSDDKTIKLWDVASSQELRTLSGHEDAVYSVVWSSDGKTLASASADKTIKLWDVASGQELRTLSGHGNLVHSVAWSSDGKALASASADKTIKLWDVASGKELRTLSGHGRAVRAVAWSSDGKTLASGSEDKTIRLWDVASGQELRTLQREPSDVYAVAFSRDGKALASGSSDSEKKQGIIRLWFAAAEEEVGRLRSK